jgi:hypothetical protein
VWHWLKKRLWFLHAPVLLSVNLSPSVCYQQLEKIARPSVSRLHLSDLFARGRRYQLEPASKRGFRLTTTSKVSWHPRRRTSPSAVLYGTFDDSDNDSIVYLHLHSRIRMTYLLQSFFWPVFLTSMIVFMPWHPLLQGVLIVSLSLAALTGYRYHARLEAHDMLFFIQKALSDYISDSPPLPAASADIVYGTEQDFARAWERFYDEQTPDRNNHHDTMNSTASDASPETTPDDNSRG